jgi:large repetitive protein
MNNLIPLLVLFFTPNILFGQIHQWHGQNSYECFGHSVSAAGDIDGDGFDDVIVGAPQTGNYSGSAFVYSGATGSLIYQWSGTTTAAFGWSVSGAGDVNNDGFDDVIVGAYTSSDIGSLAGSAYVYSGATGSLIYQWNGQNSYDYFGHSVSAAGDVNGDGFDDVIVGRPEGGASNTGSAYVYSGATGSLIYQWNGQNFGGNFNFGYSVSSAGDVDNDGFGDVIVGDSGSAYVYSGATGSLIYQWSVGGYFGHAVSAGDG